MYYSTHMGYQLISKDGKSWQYMDGTPFDKNNPAKACRVCHQHQTPEGHDPCIANLPGVAYACCGHGLHEAYVTLVDGRTIRGEFDKRSEIVPLTPEDNKSLSDIIARAAKRRQRIIVNGEE